MICELCGCSIIDSKRTIKGTRRVRAVYRHTCRSCGHEWSTNNPNIEAMMDEQAEEVRRRSLDHKPKLESHITSEE